MLWLYLTGSDFQEPIDHPELETLRPYWNATLSSESETVSCGISRLFNYLCCIKTSRWINLEILKEALSVPEKLEKLVRDFATPRYKRRL